MQRIIPNHINVRIKIAEIICVKVLFIKSSQKYIRKKKNAKCKFCDKRKSIHIKSTFKICSFTASIKEIYMQKCQKQFTKEICIKKSFQTHQNRNHRKLFNCKLCPKTFTVKSNLNRHLKVSFLNY